MAAHFHVLKISEVINETPDSVSISFEVPESEWEKFVYKEGQNITLKSTLNGEELRRSYSVCTAPYEKKLKVAVKAAIGGRFSAFAQNLKAGDTLEVLPPVGKFNARLHEEKGNYLAIAAGSGITPVISILKHILISQPKSNCTLIYGNKNRKSIIFFEELEALKNKFMERFNLIHILSRENTEAEINHGRIQKEKLNDLKHLVDFTQFNSAYICGPEEMIFTASDFLKQHGMQERDIHFELFTTPGQLVQKNKANTVDVKADIGPKSTISIKVDGRSFSFELGKKSQSILDAALAQGADLPFACKGGMCSTCKAKLLSGQVHMDINYALEPEEVEAGFILTCQSHPITDHVSVDYDIKS